MKSIKVFGLLAVAAAALMGLAGTALASSTLTSPTGTTYTGEFAATSTNFKWHGAFVTVECSHAAIKGTVEKHTTSNAGGKLSSWTFAGCNYVTTVESAGSLEIDTTNRVISKGAKISMTTSVGTCIFTTNAVTGTEIGAFTDSHETGGHAVQDINSAKIPRTGGNFLCGSSATWTGNFTFHTPSRLYVD